MFLIALVAAALVASFASRRWHFILSHGRCSLGFKGNQLRTGRTWVLKLQLGRGAGYIGGATAFIGWRVKGSRRGYTWHNQVLFDFGVTRNGNNVVPLPDDSYWKTSYLSAHDAGFIAQYGLTH